MTNITLKLLTAVLILTPGIFSTTEFVSSSVGINTMSWLPGCWQGEKDGEVFQENWMQPAGGAMLGVSRTLHDGKMTAYEFMQIKEQQEKLLYVAQPSGQKGDSFTSIRNSDTEVAFENAARAFPQRIIYRLNLDRSLFARIEGTENGQNMGMDFPMKRVKCEP